MPSAPKGSLAGDRIGLDDLPLRPAPIEDTTYLISSTADAPPAYGLAVGAWTTGAIALVILGVLVPPIGLLVLFFWLYGCLVFTATPQTLVVREVHPSHSV